MPRGGRREQRQIGGYANRTDLPSKAVLTPSAAPNQEYGKAAAQIASQRAVPMASQPVIPAPPPQSPPPASAPQRVVPGQLPPIDRPTDRPTEPVTAGAPVGAGPGPEAIGSLQPTKLADVIAAAATASGSPDLSFLASRARTLGQ